MSPTLIAAGIFSLQLSLTGVVVGFTSTSSILRPGLLLLIILCPYLQFPYLEYIHYAPLRGALGAACIYTVIIYIDAVLLHRFTFEAQGPTSSAGGLAPVKSTEIGKISKSSSMLQAALQRFQFGLSISTQGRFPATKWSVKNIPPFSRSDPDYIPKRWRFQIQTTLKVMVGFTLLALLGFAPKPEDSFSEFSSDKIALLTRWGGASREEMNTRIGSVLGYWTVQYIIHVAVHGLFAVVAVTLHASDVKSWPPVFGSIQDAYSIRRYWGNFYHQLIRRGCSSIAHFATYTVLGLKKGGIIGRYLFILFVFSVSGLFHFFCDLTQGIPSSESGAMQFFVMQSFGIMFEDAIVWTLKRVFGERLFRFHWVSKTVGYIWVTVWLIWCSPVWLYPTMQRNDGQPLIPLPSSFQAWMIRSSSDIYSRLAHGVGNSDTITLVFILLSGLLALVMVLAGTAAVLQPLTLAKNTGLSLPVPQPSKRALKTEDSGLDSSVRGQQVVTGWVILFGARELALGLAIGALLCLGELRAAAVVVLAVYVVAIGETYVLGKYGEGGSVKKVVLPSLFLLWAAPVYLLRSSHN